MVIQIGELDEEDESCSGVPGVALTERTHDYGFELPDTITVYREAILDICDTEEQVAHEIAVTVAHEIGHHFGIDDERLDELGWG